MKTVSIFGATSGVGQLIAKQAVEINYAVNAISRNEASARNFENLNGCRFLQCDARDPSSIPAAALSVDQIVITIGTTAFPTAKWEGDKNTPKIACLDSVENVLDAIDSLPKSKRPRRVTLISSIGVECSTSFPFVILNRYGVLDYKLQSELLVIERAAKGGYEDVVVRPGRLVGEPFTNLDLAKLLKLDQGSKRGILLDREDVLAGDMERNDVATAVVKLFETRLDAGQKSLLFSIINKPGPRPTDAQWEALLRDVQVPNYDDRVML